MSKRIIKLGTWNSNPVEWVVLQEDDFRLLVISRYEIGKMAFDSGNNNNWSTSSLRKFLNNDFFKNTFADAEKKKILNVVLSGDNVKDDVFILTKGEVQQLLLKDGDYENSHYRSCSYCIWTRNGVEHGYTKGCWCGHNANSTYAVRPAMYLKKDTI